VLSDSLTVAQHLRYFAAARRLSSLHPAGELVRRLGYEQSRTQVAGELSGGSGISSVTFALAIRPS
jgi:ABC-2 type transport system ATP-binding protein